MDLTGKFSLRSSDRYSTILILYDWTSNAILATPIKDANDDTMAEAFTNNVEYLSARGFKPEYNVMDNVSSKAIWNYLTKEKKFHLVEPQNHCANASKCAIQNFKKYFISGSCIGNKAFPTILWSYLVNQAQDSLNMMWTSRIYPKLSAYNVLEGTHNFNRDPCAPPSNTRHQLQSPWD